MNPENSDLDRELEGIRDEVIDPATVEAAARRVWNRLEHAALRGCEDFRALMPDHRAGRLPEARVLLLEDHIRNCVDCRKFVEGGTRKVLELPSRPSAPWRRWAVAAGLAAAVGLAGWAVLNRLGTGGPVVIQAASGTVQYVAGGSTRTVTAGTELEAGGEIRTAKDSAAVVRLPDGSLVEMRERSALSASPAGRDLTLALARGSIIVEAAKRRQGHLYVAARDCRVAVTGTVFSVNSGVKGSRVSVIEGQVKVTQGGREHVLSPGEQYATADSVTPVPVREEIAWSRNAEQHVALLRELSALEKKLEQVRLPELRYSSRLAAALPADTLLYVAIPNMAGAFAEAGEIMRRRAQESPALGEWWEKRMAGGGFQFITEHLRAVSEYLGDEIVVTLPGGAEAMKRAPVVVAELKREGFPEFVQSELQKLGGGHGHFRIVEDPAAANAARGDVLMFVRGGTVAISPDAGSLKAVAHALVSGAGGFNQTTLGRRVVECYRSGAGLVFAADLEKLAPKMPGHHQDRPGFTDLKYAILEQKETAGRNDARAVLAFSGPRKGLAAWLAKPGPIGALDYISPEASFAAGFTVRNPATMLDELAGTQDAARNLGRVESETGVNVRADLAAPLGGEVAVAIDGPVVPVPSWKLVAEVYDAGRLQHAIRKLVEKFGHGAQLAEETVGGRTWYRLILPGAKMMAEVHYCFSDGYLLAAPSRTLIERALEYRATGYTLTHSAAFAALLPRDGYTDFSGMVYQNLGSTLGGMLQFKTPEGTMSPLSKPMLVTLYGEEDRIALASSGLPIGLSPASLLRMMSPAGFLPKLD